MALKIKSKPELNNDFLLLMSLDCKVVYNQYSTEERQELIKLVDSYIESITCRRKEFTTQFYGSALGKLNAIRSVALNAANKVN